MTEFTPEPGNETWPSRETSIAEDLSAIPDIPSEIVTPLQSPTKIVSEDCLKSILEAGNDNRTENCGDDGMVGLFNLDVDIIRNFDLYSFDLEEPFTLLPLLQSFVRVRNNAHNCVHVDTLRREGKLQ